MMPETATETIERVQAAGYIVSEVRLTGGGSITQLDICVPYGENYWEITVKPSRLGQINSKRLIAMANALKEAGQDGV